MSAEMAFLYWTGACGSLYGVVWCMAGVKKRRPFFNLAQKWQAEPPKWYPPDNERRPGNWNQDIRNWNKPLIEAGVYRGECDDGGAGLDKRVTSVYSVLNLKKGGRDGVQVWCGFLWFDVPRVSAK